MHELHQRTVHADRQSLAAGRDLNLTISLNEYRELLAHRANDPHALTCQWCKLGGQAPDLDECIACGHDIGAERRAREAMQARRDRIGRLIADARQAVCYVAALGLAALLIHWRGHAGDSAIVVMLSGVFFTVLFGELLVYWSISAQVWCQITLPDKLRQLFGVRQS